MALPLPSSFRQEYHENMKWIDPIDGGLIAILCGILMLILLPGIWGIALIGCVVSAFVIFGIIRAINQRSDPREENPPPDAP